MNPRPLRPLFAALTLALLAGCGPEPAPVTEAPAPPPHLTPPAPLDLAPWRQARIDWRRHEGVTLSVLADAQPAFSALRPHLPLFEALTGIQVGYQQVEQDAMRKRMVLDFKSGAGIYDVVPMGITHLGEAHHQGWLEHLGPYLEDPAQTDAGWYDLADFSPNSLTLCQVEGHLLSLPFDFSAPILFYRKDLFARYGIQPPDTFDELVAMKRELQKALEQDGVKDVHAFATRTTVGAGLNTWTIIPVIRAYGGEMFDPRWNATFNSPQAVRALEVYRDLATGYGSPPDALTLHFYEQRERFRSGKLASAILASHFFHEIDSPAKSPIWDQWDARPMPRGPAGRRTSPWAWAFAINTASRRKGAAWLFIQWATSKETAHLLQSGGAPARRSVWEGDHYATLKAPGLIESVHWVLDEPGPDPMQSGIPEFPEAGLAASQSFGEILHGAPVQESLDKAVRRVDAIMARGPTRQGRGGHE